MSEVCTCCARLSHAFISLIAYCEVSKQISCSFDNIEDALNEMDWHLFAIENQRMILMILAVTQQPIEFLAYGNFPAN